MLAGRNTARVNQALGAAAYGSEQSTYLNLVPFWVARALLAHLSALTSDVPKRPASTIFKG
jgi:hypothetical protein